MSKEKRISTLILMVLAGFCFAVFYHYILGVYLGMGYPHNTFLFVPTDRFSDFSRVLQANEDLNPYFGPNRMLQYPLLNFLGFVFSLMPLAYAILIFISIVTGFMTIASLYSLKINGQPTNWTSVFILSLLTFPFLSDIDRGNFDGFIFILLTLFMLFFTQKKFISSAIFLSFAIAMKPFPAVFLLLFVAEKRFKEAIITVVSTVLVSLVPLLFFQGGLLANLSAALSISRFPDAIGSSGYFESNNFVFHSMSIFTMFKVYFIETGMIDNVDMAAFSSIYVKVVILVFIPIGLYVIFLEKELWRQVAILSVVMVIFPQISGNYRLLYMFVPLFLFLMKETTSSSDYFYVVLFELLLIPKNYYFFPHTMTDGGYLDFSISYPVNFFIMVFMLLAIILAGILKITGIPSVKK
jgi:hypothetical protein